MFNFEDVFTKEQIKSFKEKPDIFKQNIVEALNTRLVIRQFTSELKQDQN